MPQRRRNAYKASGSRSGTDWPPTRTWPEAGLSCPPMSRRMVVLPLPLAPMMATILPRGTDIVMPFRISRLSYAKRTSMSSIAAAAGSSRRVGVSAACDAAVVATGISVVNRFRKDVDCSGFNRTQQRPDAWRSAEQQFFLHRRQILGAAQQHQDVTGFESVLRLRHFRSRAASAHPRHLDAIAERDCAERLADGGRALGQSH